MHFGNRWQFDWFNGAKREREREKRKKNTDREREKHIDMDKEEQQQFRYEKKKCLLEYFTDKIQHIKVTLFIYTILLNWIEIKHTHN